MFPAWYEHLNWSWWTHGEHRCPLWLQSAIVCLSVWLVRMLVWESNATNLHLAVCLSFWLPVCVCVFCVSGENKFRDVGLGKQLLSNLTMTVCLTFCLSACVCVWWGWAVCLSACVSLSLSGEDEHWAQRWWLETNCRPLCLWLSGRPGVRSYLEVAARPPLIMIQYTPSPPWLHAANTNKRTNGAAFQCRERDGQAGGFGKIPSPVETYQLKYIFEEHLSQNGHKKCHLLDYNSE